MKKILTFLVIAIIFTGLGIWISPWVKQQLNLKLLLQTNSEKTFTDGWNAARQRLVDNGYMSTESEIANNKNHINGKITAIGSRGIITIETQSQDLLIEPSLKIRTIQVDDSTKIQKAIYSDANSQPNITDASLTDLAVEQFVDISSKKSINDEKIIVPSQIMIYITEEVENLKTEKTPTDETSDALL